MFFFSNFYCITLSDFINITESVYENLIQNNKHYLLEQEDNASLTTYTDGLLNLSCILNMMVNLYAFEVDWFKNIFNLMCFKCTQYLAKHDGKLIVQNYVLALTYRTENIFRQCFFLVFTFLLIAQALQVINKTLSRCQSCSISARHV